MTRPDGLQARLGLVAVLVLAHAVSPSLEAEDDTNGIGPGGMSVRPATVHLDLPESSQQLLVTTTGNDGRRIDRTRQVRYELLDPRVARVDARGRVLPLREGNTNLVVRVGGDADVAGATKVTIPVTVAGLKNPAPVSFRQQIIPILSKAGCNSGGCHGKREGQNGFKLSVFGNDPAADHQEIALHSRGRRVVPAAPEHSLLLKKSTAEVPHGGGLKIEPESLWYRRMARWIGEGARFDESPLHDTSLKGEAPKQRRVPPVHTIEIEPREVELAFSGTFQLVVTAIDSGGGRRCVTGEAEYSSNTPPIAAVDRGGLITAGKAPGEAGILVRYLGHVAVCRVTVPQPGVQFKRPPEHNFVDTHVWNKLERLGIAPSGLADDGMFLRRVFLDTIGTLPTVAEARAFHADESPDKRAKIIEHLLTRDEYADYWALRWSDLLRVDRNKITPQGAVAMTRWLRQQFRDNTPYDLFVRRVLTARGNTFAEGPASFFQAIDKPDLLGRSVSQVFLGVRIECAQCHNHPADVWRPRDYFAFAGFFSGVARKGGPGGGQIIFPRGGSDLKDPRGKVVPTAALGADPVDLATRADRRAALADWLVARDNPYFAKLIVNRLWAHYFGRGLVEPIDDLRETNPPTNVALLDALARHLVEHNFDLKALTRTLLNSRVYQLSSETNPTNRRDEQNHSHALYKPMPAEVLLDAISQATGIPEEFNGWPRGYRAIQVWDNSMPSYFFKIFGRPARVTVCECERTNEPSIAQALHLLNAPEVAVKIRHRGGRARALARSKLSPPEIIDDLYLATLSRFPRAPEREVLLAAFRESEGKSGIDRRWAVEDVLWVLLNTKRFVFVH